MSSLLNQSNIQLESSNKLCKSLLLVFLRLIVVLTSVGGEERRITSTEISIVRHHSHAHHQTTLKNEDTFGNSNGSTNPFQMGSPLSVSSMMSTIHPIVVTSPLLYGGRIESQVPPPEVMASKTSEQDDDGTTEDILTVSSNSSRVRNRTRKPSMCNTKALDKCLAQVPPMPDIGIPSSIIGVQSACSSFNHGMSCVDKWANRCLKPENIKKFQASISGAHETFTFLCRDVKFRTAYLKHRDCFKKISPKWDECSKNFIEDMKRYHHHANATVHCCVRLSFLHCVAEISHLYCNLDAASFLQRMAETLIRTTMKTHTPPQCASIQPKNCSMFNSSPLTVQPEGRVIGSLILLTYLLKPYLF